MTTTIAEQKAADREILGSCRVGDLDCYKAAKAMKKRGINASNRASCISDEAKAARKAAGRKTAFLLGSRRIKPISLGLSEWE